MSGEHCPGLILSTLHSPREYAGISLPSLSRCHCSYSCSCSPRCGVIACPLVETQNTLGTAPIRSWRPGFSRCSTLCAHLSLERQCFWDDLTDSVTWMGFQTAQAFVQERRFHTRPAASGQGRSLCLYLSYEPQWVKPLLSGFEARAAATCTHHIRISLCSEANLQKLVLI